MSTVRAAPLARVAALLQLGLGGILAVLGVLFYFAWTTDGGGHGEVAFFFLGSVAFIPLGVAFVISGLALRSRWRSWPLLQLPPAAAVGAFVAWFGTLR